MIRSALVASVLMVALCFLSAPAHAQSKADLAGECLSALEAGETDRVIEIANEIKSWRALFATKLIGDARKCLGGASGEEWIYSSPRGRFATEVEEQQYLETRRRDHLEKREEQRQLLEEERQAREEAFNTARDSGPHRWLYPTMLVLTLAVLAPVILGGQTGGRKWTTVISKLVAIFLLFTPLFTASFILGSTLSEYSGAVFPTFGYHPLILSWDLFAVVLAPVLIGFGIVIAFHSRIQEIDSVDLKWILSWFAKFTVLTGIFWFIAFLWLVLAKMDGCSGSFGCRPFLWIFMSPIVLATAFIIGKNQES